MTAISVAPHRSCDDQSLLGPPQALLTQQNPHGRASSGGGPAGGRDAAEGLLHTAARYSQPARGTTYTTKCVTIETTSFSTSIQHSTSLSLVVALVPAHNTSTTSCVDKVAHFFLFPRKETLSPLARQPYPSYKLQKPGWSWLAVRCRKPNNQHIAGVVDGCNPHRSSGSIVVSVAQTRDTNCWAPRRPSAGFSPYYYTVRSTETRTKIKWGSSPTCTQVETRLVLTLGRKQSRSPHGVHSGCRMSAESAVPKAIERS